MSYEISPIEPMRRTKDPRVVLRVIYNLEGALSLSVYAVHWTLIRSDQRCSKVSNLPHWPRSVETASSIQIFSQGYRYKKLLQIITAELENIYPKSYTLNYEGNRLKSGVFYEKNLFTTDVRKTSFTVIV